MLSDLITIAKYHLYVRNMRTGPHVGITFMWGLAFLWNQSLNVGIPWQVMEMPANTFIKVIVCNIYCIFQIKPRYILYCIFYTVYFILYILYCIFYTVYFILHILYLYILYFIFYTVYFITAYFILYILYCILYTVYFILYILYCILQIKRHPFSLCRSTCFSISLRRFTWMRMMHKWIT